MFGKPVPPQQMQVVAHGPGPTVAQAYGMKQNIQAAIARPLVIEHGLFMGITQYINVGKTIKDCAPCNLS
jgi:hypothetical protein